MNTRCVFKVFKIKLKYTIYRRQLHTACESHQPPRRPRAKQWAAHAECPKPKPLRRSQVARFGRYITASASSPSIVHESATPLSTLWQIEMNEYLVIIFAIISVKLYYLPKSSGSTSNWDGNALVRARTENIAIAKIITHFILKRFFFFRYSYVEKVGFRIIVILLWAAAFICRYFTIAAVF